MGIIKFCNHIIEYSFYLLFLLVPLVFTSATSELFELNKMWLTWGLTIIIAASWFTKMIVQRRILLCRTPLDLPILLFLLSQIISTIFSLDSHVSLWGYYSRFNGGLLSTISYILLYYAFVSSFISRERHESENEKHEKNVRDFGETNAVQMVKRLLLISLISGLVVGLWGLPSHFGYDPTCLVFRGTFDVSCWTEDFLPQVRIFSTLGQPAWLAAYLAILIPISIAYFLKKRNSLIINHLSLILLVLFYVDLLFANTRSGFLGIWAALFFFFGVYIFKAKSEKLKAKSYLLLVSLLLLITFVIGTPLYQLNKFTLSGIKDIFKKSQETSQVSFPASQNPPSSQTSQISKQEGGTESGNIRLNVWQGAINIWKDNPIFGTGVETFAFAYYKYKPASQNLTSEWNFLYNKAHNEYLNYLATTGIVGLGTYLGMIVFFLVRVIPNLFRDLTLQKNEMLKSIRQAQDPEFTEGQVQHDNNKLLTLALIAAYISILITNFFGFSVVITNIYLFMIPAFVFVLSGILKSPTIQTQQNKAAPIETGTSVWQWTSIFFILVACLFLLITLFRFWQADVSYSRGYNLDRAGEYQTAYPYLQEALKLRGSEPVFKDGFSVNNAIIAAGLIAQIDENTDKVSQEQIIVTASKHAQDAINISNEAISKHPNNVVFWKTRTKLFHTLSQVDSRYLPRAQDAIEKAVLLAPTDANIFYNLGVLYGQNNNVEKGIEILEKAVTLKPDYRDARYALGLFYRTASLDKQGKIVVDQTLNQKAIDQMQYILDNIAPHDSAVKESLEDWTK